MQQSIINRSFWLFYGLALLLLIRFLYRDSYQLFFAQDDWWFLRNVGTIHSWRDFGQRLLQADHFYRPVPRVALLYAEYALFGTQALAYHWVSTVLLTMNALLAALLAWRQIGSALVTFLTGLLYAVHPINYLLMVWISGQQELLLVLLMSLAMLLYADYRQRGGGWRYGLALLAGALALCSKDTALVLPIWASALALAAPSRHTLRHTLLELSGFMVLTAGYLLARTALAQVDLRAGPYRIDVHGAVIARNLWTYALDIPGLRMADLNPALAGPSIVAALLLGGIWLAWRVRRAWRSLVALLIWALSALLPPLVLAEQNGSYYLALPLVALAPLLVWMLWELAQRVSRTPALQMGLVLLVALGGGFSLDAELQRTWRADMGGIRYKAAMSQLIWQQIQAQYPQLPPQQRLYVYHATPRMWWSWGQGALFDVLYPELTSVEHSSKDPNLYDPVRAPTVIFVFRTQRKAPQ